MWLERRVAHPPTTSEWADDSSLRLRLTARVTLHRVYLLAGTGQPNFSQGRSHAVSWPRMAKHVKQLLNSRKRYAFFVCTREKPI
jgi:hypothetical protein